MRRKFAQRRRTDRNVMYTSETIGMEDPGVPDTPHALLETRRETRWRNLKDSLDWTRYHLNVVVVSADNAPDVRLAAGIFERVARFNGCAGALPVFVTTCLDGTAVPELGLRTVEQLCLGRQWSDCDVEVFDETSRNYYDVLVCLDSGAAERVEQILEASGIMPKPPHIIDLSDYGAYLQLRRPESPMYAWVPDYRAKFDPTFDERQAAARPPCDDALAIWHCMPEDLARIVQPRFEDLSRGLGCLDEANGDDALAHLAFHMSGLVRFLMDSYPLDLQGGPGYDGPP